MRQIATFKPTLVKKFLALATLSFLFLGLLTSVFNGNLNVVSIANATTAGSCNNGIDDDGDGRMDWKGGIDKNNNPIPPDPSCINANSIEKADDVAKGSLIPCTNKCDLGSVLHLLNNLIEFLIKTILLPLTVVLFMYAGFKYITAEGNPSKVVSVKKMIGHLVLGIVLVLTSWVIVKTLLVVLGYTDDLYFFE